MTVRALELKRITLYASLRAPLALDAVTAARADQNSKSDESTAPNLLLERAAILAEDGVFGNGRVSVQAIEPDL